MQLNEYIQKMCIMKKAFAKKIGVSYQTLIYWINGRSMPTVLHIKRLDEITNGEVTLDDWCEFLANKKEKKRKRSKKSKEQNAGSFETKVGE